jgi:hypothetical protein
MLESISLAINKFFPIGKAIFMIFSDSFFGIEKPGIEISLNRRPLGYQFELLSG